MVHTMEQGRNDPDLLHDLSTFSLLSFLHFPSFFVRKFLKLKRPFEALSFSPSFSCLCTSHPKLSFFSRPRICEAGHGQSALTQLIDRLPDSAYHASLGRSEADKASLENLSRLMNLTNCPEPTVGPPSS